jgi:hypothetical protein
MSFTSIRNLPTLAGIGAATMALLLSSAPAIAGPIIGNGSFETTTPNTTANFSINSPGAGGGTVASWAATPTLGGTNVIDCLVAPGGVANQPCGNSAYLAGFTLASFPGLSPDGGNYVLIDGDNSPGNNNSTPFTTSVTGLTVGATYSISFYQAAGVQAGPYGLPTTEWFQVTFGSQVLSTSHMSTPSQSSTGWNLQTLVFTASSATQALQFLALGTPSGGPPIVLLDGVSISNTPEPATNVLIGLGLVSIPLARKLFKKRS